MIDAHRPDKSGVNIRMRTAGDCACDLAGDIVFIYSTIIEQLHRSGVLTHGSFSSASAMVSCMQLLDTLGFV